MDTVNVTQSPGINSSSGVVLVTMILGSFGYTVTLSDADDWTVESGVLTVAVLLN
ncbi:hypothetical protein D030_1804 [Vibrio parahaemolyticus AQ3810]|nr:hypothetical protein D037_0774 [Vibrio parahaemolyticus IDH02640]ETX58989.1 hypothetical protein D038_0701 [Vibrio parahaemolyticus IDH02189]EXF70790.1 hypothetical protein D030_1804 [Vibrio parahaemolyticus AQ3810]